MGYIAAIVGAVVAAGSTAYSGYAASQVPDPFLPQFTDPKLTAKENLDFQLANFEEASKLAAKENQFNTEQIKLMLGQAGADLIAKQQEVAMGELSGKVSPDEINFLSARSAALNLGRGTSGSAAGDFSTLKALDKRYGDVVNAGFSHAQQWLAQAQSRIPQLSNVSNMFLTPAQAVGVQQQNTQIANDSGWLNDQLAAAGDPTQRALALAIARLGGNVGGTIAAQGGAYGFGGSFTDKLQAQINSRSSFANPSATSGGYNPAGYPQFGGDYMDSSGGV